MVKEVVLLIDGDLGSADKTLCCLRSAGYKVLLAGSGVSAFNALEQNPKLIVMEAALVGYAKFALLRLIRQRGFSAPILVLSSVCDVDSRVEGLRSGADDYLPKPFHAEELLARVEALLRRYAAFSPLTINLPPLFLNLETRKAYLDGNFVRLTRREFEILAMLAKNAGRVVSFGEIIEQGWNGEEVSDRHIVMVHMSTLRKKLEGAPNHYKMIVTERGIGYRLLLQNGRAAGV